MLGGSLVYLFAAYTVVFVVLFGYMFYVSQQIGDVRTQLDALRRQRQAPKPAPSAPRKPKR